MQVTYVGLALLMGGGLVLSGIGSDASGGLLDAFIGGGTGQGDARKPFENQIKDANKRLAANPKDQAALATLVRANYGLANLERNEVQGQAADYKPRGQERLREADAAWGRYLATDPDRIDAGLAGTALQMYSPIALGAPQDRQKVIRPATAIAEQENTSLAYLRLFAEATRVGDTRTAGLAERKALSLAGSKDERKEIKQQIDQARAEAASQAAGGDGAAPQGP